MAKKTYKTYSLKGLQILLFDDHGRQIEVNFKAGAQIDSTAKFTTSDEKVQEAIEKCSSFGRDFYLESVHEKNTHIGEAPSVAEETAHTDVEEPIAETEAKTEEAAEEDGVVKVADKSEAIEWLKENYPDNGYTATKLRSKEAFEAACKECGVVFEIG